MSVDGEGDKRMRWERWEEDSLRLDRIVQVTLYMEDGSLPVIVRKPRHDYDESQAYHDQFRGWD